MKKNTFQIIVVVLIVFASAYSSAFLTLSQKENIEKASVEVQKQAREVVQHPDVAVIDVHLPDIFFIKQVSDFVVKHLPAE